MVSGLATWAQSDIMEKLSVSSQLFLDEMKSKTTKRSGAKGGSSEDQSQRFYAAPETIDGRDYISCFLRLKDNADVTALEKLGVQVQCRFDKGIITANVPVDNFMAVAELANVNEVSVATMMTPTTYVAREKTNTDDVLTRSADAIGLGLSKAYDGTGVLLGIIDTGIDFQHIAFKDKDGKSRIVGAYVYSDTYKDGAEITDATEIAGLTTDTEKQDHGTHTSSTAGGSSVIVNKNSDDTYTFTVTDNHAAATYGGMAPGASLYLAGLKSLEDTHLANATQKIVQYADDHNMPVVISNSWGSQVGPHDGTGTLADIYNQYFDDAHPNHIALFAASNDAGNVRNGEVGGFHVSGTISKQHRLATVIRASGSSDSDYSSYFTSIWTRSKDITHGLTVTVYVLNEETGKVLYSIPYSATTEVSLSDYFEGKFKVTFDSYNAGKKYVLFYSGKGIKMNSNDQGQKYTLAIDIRLNDDADGSTDIDLWGRSYFTGPLNDNWGNTEHNWTAGSDDMCVSDEATITSIIPVGAYMSKKNWTKYNGKEYHLTNNSIVGDIAPFSSYATAEESPTGRAYPWISAPGSMLAAGLNHYHTADPNSYYSQLNDRLVVNSADYPYGVMQGTSMATPTAAGIVALWLQYAKEQNKTLTTSQVKEIMHSSAIHDSYTGGTNSSHFGGNGKINALGGFVSEWPGTYYALSDNGNNTQAISDASKSQNAYVVLNDRTLYKDKKWNTLCLPFGVTDTDIDDGHPAATGGLDGKSFTGTPLEGATVMELDTEGSYTHTTGAHKTGLDADSKTLYLNFKAVNEIEAGKPYIIKWENGDNLVNPTFSGVSVKATAPSPVTFDGGWFIGTYVGQKFSETDSSILFLGSENTLYYPLQGATIGAQRAYFKLGDSQGGGETVRNFVLNFFDEQSDDAAGITTPTFADSADSDAWYSVDGLKYNGKPTVRGLFIHRGHKVVVP